MQPIFLIIFFLENLEFLKKRDNIPANTWLQRVLIENWKKIDLKVRTVVYPYAVLA